MFDVQYGTFFYLIANLFRICTLYKFIHVFLKKFRYSLKIEISVFFIYFLINSFSFLIFHLPLVNLIVNISVFFIIALMYDGKIQMKIFATVMIYAVNMCVESICSEFILAYYEGSNQNYLLFVFSIANLLLFLVVLIIEKCFNNTEAKKLTKIHWIAILTIPPISIFIMVVMISSSLNRLVVVAAITCLFAVNLMVFYLYDNLGSHYVDEFEKRVLLEQYNHAYRKQMEIMRESQKRLQMFKHDMKNHMANMIALVKMSKTDDLLEYIQDTMEFIEVPGSYVNSGNDCIDSILNMKIKEAKAFDALVEYQIKVPPLLKIEPFYLNMILANLLDNAIEAIKNCEEKRIQIEIELMKGILYITISNTFKGELLHRNKHFFTTKNDKTEHGIGLKNVDLSVKKYGGSLEITNSANLFTASVMLFDKSDKELNL